MIRRAAALLAVLVAAALALIGPGFSCASPAGAPSRPAVDLSIPRTLAGAPIVRVALVRGAPRASIEVRGPYEVYASEAAGARPAFAGASLPPVEAALDEGGDGLRLGTYALRPAFARIVASAPGTLLVDGQAYRGELVLRDWKEPRGLLVLNLVHLEEYVAGVVGCEMPLSYPDAALRAQAVAARSYGYYAVRTRGGAPYDVADDQSSQVYAGLKNETPKAREVTLGTGGLVLAFEGRIFSSYFHSTCGGGTIPASWVFGEAPIRPLEGAECGFCGDSKYHRWRAELSKAEIAARLAKQGTPVRAVSRVEVVTRGPRGYAGAVRLSHPEGAVEMKAERFRFMVGASVVRSTWFDVEDPGGEKVVVSGRGFGHGVGLCQVGARGAARAGMDERAILGRYYPGAEMVRLYAVAESGGGAGGGAGTETGAR
jgi:stage II sporulation protein D